MLIHTVVTKHSHKKDLIFVVSTALYVSILLFYPRGILQNVQNVGCVRKISIFWALSSSFWMRR